VTSNHNTITRNILTDNFYGIQLAYGTEYNLISGNHIYQNGRCGVYFNHSSYNTLIGNIVENHPVNGFGLYEFSNNNMIMNNTLSMNGFNGVNIRESYNTHVMGNSFLKNHVGLHLPAPEYHTSTCGNVFSENAVSFEEERDMIAPTVVVYSILVFIGFLLLKKRYG
jgi:parallel beta-helix repeat protein